MLSSKEALEKLCKVKIYQKEASAYDYLGKEVYKEEINLIKQDLERLEVLEIENQDLKDNEKIITDYGFNLVQENEKLEKKLDIINRFGKFLYEPTDDKNLIRVFLQVPIFNKSPNVDIPTTDFLKVEIGLITKEELEVLGK